MIASPNRGLTSWLPPRQNWPPCYWIEGGIRDDARGDHRPGRHCPQGLPTATDAWEGVEALFCSRTPATVEWLQAQYRVPWGTTDLDKLLSWEPQTAFVLTPSPTHRAIARRLVESVVDVFVEKPATMRSAETQELA